ncbi:MAG: hypothetical protein K2I37_05715 [Muribaculaceae bacterium]|nr:hypothetical protein [Muribaculaceae bacterium]MDE5957392.1 hypothetical protein [Muribaculaceae bacterium]
MIRQYASKSNQTTVSLKLIYATFILIITLNLFCGCSRSNRQNQHYLNRAEQLIDSMPEQSLLLLDSIPESDLLKAEDHARFILLHAIAEDKIYHLTTSDSLIDTAIEYFRCHNDISNLRKALSVKGRILELSGHEGEAFVSLLEAESLIDSETPEFEKGLLYHQLGDCANSCLNGQQAMNYITLACENYNKTGKYLHAAYAQIDQAQYALTLSQYEKALTLCLQVEDSASKWNDNTLHRCVLETLSRSYLYVKDYPNALKTLSELYNSYDDIDAQTLGLLTLAEAKAGNVEHADSLGKALIQDGNPWGIYGLHPTTIKEKDFLNAFYKINEQWEDVFGKSYKNDLTHVIQENFVERQKLIIQQVNSHRIITVGLIVFIILIIAVAIYIFVQSRKKLSIAKAQAECISHDFIKFLRAHQETMKEMESTTLNMKETTSEFINNQITTLTRLVDTCYGKKALNSTTNRHIISIVDDIISDFRNNKIFIKEMTTVIDSKYDGIITTLKEEAPTLDSKEILLFSLLVGKLSSILISKILELNSVQYFAVLKHRLKNKIIQLNPPSLKQILSYF